MAVTQSATPTIKSSTSIVQHNNFTTARFDFSALEINILVLVIRTLNQQGQDNDYYQFHFEVDKLKEYQKGEIKTSRIKRALQGLQKKVFEFNQNGNWVSCQLVGGVKITKDDRRIYFNIDPYIKPLLYDLKEHYTLFELESIFRLTSKYAKRLYPMCCQFKSSTFWTIRVDEIHKRLRLPDSYCEKYAMMYARVLGPAIDEINKVTDINVEVPTRHRKKGTKTIEALTFRIRPQSKQVINDLEKKIIDRLESYGLQSWQAYNVLLTLPTEQVRKLVYQISVDKSNGVIRGSMGAYTAGVFKNHGVPFEGAIET